MNSWKTLKNGKTPVFKNPVLLEGLPGIGNVGKVAVDFLVDELSAKKIATFTSNSLPNSVFVNEKNLVEMPVIELYHKKGKNQDILFLVGDVQPIDEPSCFMFCKEVLNVFGQYGGKEIITLGGIGLQDIPKTPKIYCTGNSKKIITKFKDGTKLSDKLYGVVGPIVGVSGLLTGMAKEKKIDAICLLAETYGHPMYLGVKGAREILKIITKKLGLQISLAELEKEIEEIELSGINKQAETAVKGQAGVIQKGMQEQNYIG